MPRNFAKRIDPFCASRISRFHAAPVPLGDFHKRQFSRFSFGGISAIRLVVDIITRIFLVSVAVAASGSIRAAEPRIAAPHFVGSQSCKSSSCHGGGSDKGQSVIWDKKDKHVKAHEILGDERSRRMAESMGIGDPLKSARCTICHSPMEALPASRFAPKTKIDRGVSCESCHGPAEKWLLFHTRKDVSHDQRVAAGLREAGDFYHRSNMCIACHHVVDPGLIAAGHPELFFELDRQMAEEPPHWKDEGTWLGPRAWLTGQAAGLREISWRLTSAPDAALVSRWKALVWLLRQTEAGASLPNTDDFAAMQAASDRVARAASRQDWGKDSAMRLLKNYAGITADFRDGKVEPADLRRRGEVLVLAIDRLWSALKTESKLESENFDKALKILTDESKGQGGFDAVRFSGALQSVEAALELMPKR